MKLRYIFLVLLLGAAAYSGYLVQYVPYENTIKLSDIPSFTPFPIAFKHEHKSGKALPFAGATTIEVDSDETPEIFLSGGYLQRDGLFKFKDNQFVDISEESGLTKDIGDSGYGAASIDVNKDGYVDLIVARDSGLYLYLNQDGVFAKQKLSIEFAAGEVPLSIALGDINLDGFIDLFVACFSAADRLDKLIFTQPPLAASSKLLLNNGDNTFTDVAEAAGLPMRQNAYSAAFVELNGDRYLDLVVAYQARPATIFENVGGTGFKQHSIVTPKGSPLAIGVASGDINRDGKMDLLFTSTGSSVPSYILNLDEKLHTEWSLLINQGQFKFKDVADSAMIAKYPLAWGVALADFNLDGLLDIAAVQNAIGYPPNWAFKNAGLLLIQKEDETFAATQEDSDVKNSNYGITPLVADFSNDGYPDLIWVNIDGQTQGYINNGGNAHYIKVDLGDSPESLGSKVWLTDSASKKTLAQQYASGSVASDQSHILTFGLGPKTTIQNLEIHYLSGKSLQIESPELDQTISLKSTQAETPTALPVEETPEIQAITEEETPDGNVSPPAPEPEEPTQSTEDELESLLVN